MKELKARTGYYLTQYAEVGDERVCITSIKSMSVKEEDWRETTEEEKLDYEAEQEKKLALE